MVRSLRSRGGEIPAFAPRDLACLDYQNIPALFNRSICSADAFIAPDTYPVLGDIPPSISRLTLPPAHSVSRYCSSAAITSL